MNLTIGSNNPGYFGKVRFRNTERLKKAEVLIFHTVDFLDMP